MYRLYWVARKSHGKYFGGVIRTKGPRRLGTDFASSLFAVLLVHGPIKEFALYDEKGNLVQ